MKVLFNKVALVYLTIAIAMSGGCTKHNEHAPFYSIPREANLYVVFPKGSYWVYEEIGTLNVDTVHMYRSEVIRMDASEKLGYDLEQFRARYKNTFRNDSTEGLGLPFHNDQNLWSYREAPIQGAFTTPTMCFLHPILVGESRRYTEDWTITLESRVEGMKILGVNYDSVLVFKHNREVSMNQAQRTYYSKHVGIIKKELFNGEVWQLKSYLINK